MKELGEKNRSVSRTAPALGGGGTEAGVRSPHREIESEEKHLRLRVKQVWQPKWNENRQSLLQPYIPWIGTLVPWKVQRLGGGA